MDHAKPIKRYSPKPDFGLTSAQVEERKRNGLINRQPTGITKTTGQIICENLFTWFNGLNFGVAVCIALVGAYRNLLFLGVILLNILIGIVQELRSKRVVEKLSVISAPRVCVLREGRREEIAVEEILLDDIMLLKLGNQVCADSNILSGEVEVDESLLTGEAEPVPKTVGDSLLSGSFIVSGSCLAQAEHIGAENYAARIATEAKKQKKVDSVLLQSLNQVVKFTGFFVIPLGIFLFLSAYLWLDEGLKEAVVSASGAVLGMLPKGLVLLTSVSLAVGVIKLATKKTLVQELFCIETLSRVDTLCLDKTGTITEGRMSVSSVIELEKNRLPRPLEETVSSFLAALEDENATFSALRARFGANASLRGVGKTPFSSHRKWSSVTFENAGTLLLGAPEILLKNPGLSLPQSVEDAAKAGCRVLLFGWSPESVSGILPQTLYPVAAVLFRDPVRADARETLEFFRTQDVNLKIISGDHPVTVSAVAKEAGLRHYDSYIDLSGLPNEAIDEVAEQYTIFGRVSPEQKRLLVRALKEKGHTVAMTGDGVNDVLALKDADCSIAMASGSDAARQVAQLVLLDSNFSALPEVVMEGRRVVNNITRTASLFLVKTIFSFLLSFAALAFGMTYPLEPIQLTLIGVFAEGIPSFILALEPNRERVRGNFLKTVLGRAFPTAILIVFYLVAVDWIAPLVGLTGLEAATLSVYLAGTAWLFRLLAVCRPFNKLRGGVWLLVTAGFFLTATLLRGVFNLGLLSAGGWLVFFWLVALCYPLQLLLEWGMRRYYRLLGRRKKKRGDRE